MRRRLGAALLAIVFILAACASVACVGAHLGHCRMGSSCETCPVLLAFLRLFDTAAAPTAAAVAAWAVVAAGEDGRALPFPVLRRTPVADRVQMND